MFLCRKLCNKCISNLNYNLFNKYTLKQPICWRFHSTRRLEEAYKLVKTKCQSKKLPQDVNPKAVFACNELDLKEVKVYGFDYDYTLACYKPSLEHLLYNLGRQTLIEQYKMKEETEQPERIPVVSSGYEQPLEWEARKLFFRKNIPKQATTANNVHASSINNVIVNGTQQKDAPGADYLVGGNNSEHWPRTILSHANVLQKIKQEETEQPEHTPVVYLGYERPLEWEARKVFLHNKLIPREATTANIVHASSINIVVKVNGTEQKDALAADHFVGGNNSGHWSHTHLPPPASVLQGVKRKHREHTIGLYSRYERTFDWEAREIFLTNKLMSKKATTGNVAHGSSISNLGVEGAKQEDASGADSVIGYNKL